jgi:hypothetical protein
LLLTLPYHCVAKVFLITLTLDSYDLDFLFEMAPSTDENVVSPKVAENGPVHGLPAVPVSAVGKVQKVKHPRGKYVQVVSDTRNVVRHGEISEQEANEVWRQCLAAWGISESSPEEREELMDALTQALVSSTSKSDENLDTRFLFGNNYLSFRPIYDAVSALPGTNNDSGLRVFVRSFRSAEFACRMFDLLDNAGNVSARQEMAYRTNGPVEHAPYMIDVSDALVRHSGRQYTQQELALFTKYRTARVMKAMDRAHEVGMVTTPMDTSSRNAATTVAPEAAPPAPAEVRTSMTSLGRLRGARQ